MKIKKVFARTLLDSRKKQTIEIFINGIGGAAPSGTSKSKFEALDYTLPIPLIVKEINKNLAKKLKNFKFERFEDLKKIENLCGAYGGNPCIALEFALLKAWAKDEKKELWELLNPRAKNFPRILANVVGGGAHAPKSKLKIQEILISPREDSFENDVKTAKMVHRALAKFSIKMKTLENAWIINKPLPEILKLISKLNHSVEIGCDFAASNFWVNNKYHWPFGSLNSIEHFKYVSELIEKFKLFYVEDPFHQSAFLDFKKLTNKFKYTLICGDDLIATNSIRLKQAIAERAINTVIIKPNQSGSLIKTKEVLDLAFTNDITPVLSHRSGETLDNTIADLAFAWQVPLVKFGISGKERLAKLDRLIEIEKRIK
ncbi:MAG: hypothetical protein QW625_00135 [Candidatus Nanoarchaeia archaeon]